MSGSIVLLTFGLLVYTAFFFFSLLMYLILPRHPSKVFFALTVLLALFTVLNPEGPKLAYLTLTYSAGAKWAIFRWNPILMPILTAFAPWLKAILCRMIGKPQEIGKGTRSFSLSILIFIVILFIVDLFVERDLLLVESVLRRHLAGVRFYILLGANADSTAKWKTFGYSGTSNALVKAVELGDRETARLLLRTHPSSATLRAAMAKASNIQWWEHGNRSASDDLTFLILQDLASAPGFNPAFFRDAAVTAASTARLPTLRFLLQHHATQVLGDDGGHALIAEALKPETREYTELQVSTKEEDSAYVAEDWTRLAVLAKGKESVLVNAIQKETFEMLDLLTQAGADVNSQDADGNTPLLSYCKNENQAHLKGHYYRSIRDKLLSLGADPFILNRQGENAFQCFRTLWIEFDPPRAKDDQFIFHRYNEPYPEYIRTRMPPSEEYRKKWVVRTPKELKSFVKQAALLGDVDMLPGLKWYGVVNELSPGQLKEVFFDSVVISDGKDPLGLRSKPVSSTSMKTSVRERALIDLHRRVQEAIQFFLSEGMDINVRNESGDTLLLQASKTLYEPDITLPILQFLMDKGADPNIRDRQGRTAYNYTSEDSRFKTQTSFLNPSTIK